MSDDTGSIDSTLRARLRSGDWLTPRRIRAYASILIGLYVVVIALTAATSTGLVDARGRPLGTDFATFWSAGQLALRGTPELAYDPAQIHAEQQRIFDDGEIGIYGWYYPPYFFAIAASLAALPYLPALVLWQLATASLYLAVIHRIAPRRLALVLALAFPAVLVNLTHGQNGFLSAALLGGGLVALRSRPILAGVLFGLLAYKPQAGLLIPFALLARGDLRALGAAAATVAAMTLASVGAFGAEAWAAFLANLGFSSSVVLEGGATGWHKHQSLFAAVRNLGGSTALAYVGQIALAGASLVIVVRLWRSGAAFPIQAAGLAAGTLLATPFLYDYDLLMLAPALAFLGTYGISTGFRPWEASALAFVFVAPLFSRVVGNAAAIPLGLIAMLALIAIVLARSEKGSDDGRGEPPRRRALPQGQGRAAGA